MTSSSTVGSSTRRQTTTRNENCTKRRRNVKQKRRNSSSWWKLSWNLHLSCSSRCTFWPLKCLKFHQTVPAKSDAMAIVRRRIIPLLILLTVTSCRLSSTNHVILQLSYLMGSKILIVGDANYITITKKKLKVASLSNPKIHFYYSSDVETDWFCNHLTGQSVVECDSFP